MDWTVIQQGAWAGRVSKDLRRSPVTTREICETTVRGSLDTVINFWKAVGFDVAYDVIKEGNQCRCHQGGFGVDIIWSVVHCTLLDGFLTVAIYGQCCLWP